MADAKALTSTPDAAAGNPIDVTTVATGAGTVDRQRVSLADASATNNAAVTAAGALKVDNSAVTQPVSAATLPLPTGASTEATLALIKAKTDNLDVLLSSRTKPADTQKIDGSAVTQPVSAAALPLPSGAATDATLAARLAEATFTGRINTQGQKTMATSTPVVVASDQSALPMSAAALPLPTGASTEATLALIKAKTDNLDVAISTRTKAADLQNVTGTIVSNVGTGTRPVAGDVASGSADSGNPVKMGALAKSGLPTAVTDAQRVNVITDLYGRQRVLVERAKLLGSYKFESGRLTVQASAHAATAGFFWLINPVGSGVVAYVKKLFATAVPVAATVFTTSPRVTVERVTFTGTASGATITPCKRDSNDAANVCTVRTASTGLTLTAGATCADFTVPAVLTAVGIAVPIDQWFYDASDEDDLLVLRAGEGLVFRQPDAGSTSDTRLLLIFGSWEER